MANPSAGLLSFGLLLIGAVLLLFSGANVGGSINIVLANKFVRFLVGTFGVVLVIVGLVGVVRNIFPSAPIGDLSPTIEAPTIEAPTTGVLTPASSSPIELTLWHAYRTGSAEEVALSSVVEQARIDLPEIKITVVQVPFSDIFNRYRTEVAAGGGPDMFIAPNDSIGDDARAGLIADITDLANGKLYSYSPESIGGMSVVGRLYGIPESLKAVELWYNKDMLITPPATTDALKNLMEGGTPVGIAFGCYHHWGFYGAFGGKVFDDDFNIVTDQGTGMTDAMTYLDELYQIAQRNGWPTTDSDSLAPFSEGRIAAVTNGNWVMGDYKNALGDKLGVAPLPAGPSGKATPMLGVDGFYFNPNGHNIELAIEAALYLTNTASETVMMNQAGHIPSNATVAVTDPLLRSFITAVNTGVTVRPQSPQLGKYWENFCTTDQVFEGGVDAAVWVAEASANAKK